jgi:malate dehydrogenase (oxaloacetate-decarboxylating)
LRKALAVDATIVEGLSGIATAPVILSDAEDLVAQVRQLPREFGAVFMVRTATERARAVAKVSAEGGLRAVLTEEDASAAALCAAALRYLQQAGKKPERSRVLAADGARNPTLAPLLMICGVFDLSVWNEIDAKRFPLSAAVRDTDVVVDLRPTRDGPDDLAPDRPTGSVIRATGLDARALVAPGLLRTVSAFPPGEAPVSLSMLRLTALAIARAAPHMHLPSLLVDGVADLVANATRRTIDPRLLGS